MMEKRFKAVVPQPLIVDGNVYGLVSVSNTKLFKVKQIVKLQIPGSDPLTVEIKRIESSTVMYVGPVGGSIDNRTNTPAGLQWLLERSSTLTSRCGQRYPNKK
jgi:hypothetical protein